MLGLAKTPGFHLSTFRAVFVGRKIPKQQAATLKTSKAKPAGPHLEVQRDAFGLLVQHPVVHSALALDPKVALCASCFRCAARGFEAYLFPDIDVPRRGSMSA